MIISSFMTKTLCFTELFFFSLDYADRKKGHWPPFNNLGFGDLGPQRRLVHKHEEHAFGASLQHGTQLSVRISHEKNFDLLYLKYIQFFPP